MKRRFRLGFSLLELFVALTVIAILAVLILPAINSEREVDRKQTCSANLRQIGLAELEYEQTYKRLSCLNMTWGYGSAGGNFFTQAPNYDGAGRWSGFIALLPFLDRDPLYKAFQYGTVGRWDNQLLRWGPYGSVPAEWTAVPTKARIDVLRYPWSSEYQPNRTQIHLFRCPSDPARMRPGSMWNLARTNYAFCLGDGQIGINGDDPIEDQTRGAFQRNRYFTLSDINDGASNTIMFGEIATPESSSFTNQGHWVSETDAKVQGRSIYELDLQPDMRGIDVKACRDFVSGGRYIGTQRNWSNIGIRCYDSLATYTGFNTINPPNGGSCTPTSNPWGEGEGIYTASSYHVGGVHVINFDGSVRFFVDEVDTLSSSPPALADGYYSPARQQINGRWTETPNWKSESPFGFWSGLGTRASNDWELGLHR